jgi:hypothetical protein
MNNSTEKKLITVLKDRRLSAKAKGVFAYLCFFEGEKVSEMEMREGVWSMKAAFRELKAHGYVGLRRGKRKGIRNAII